MCQKILKSRFYILTHTPTEWCRPGLLGLVRAAPYYDELFQKYKEDAKRQVAGGGGATYLSKRDIERWGYMPPCGPRVQVIEAELPRMMF